MRKRALSLLLCFVMCLSLLPAWTSAEVSEDAVYAEENIVEAMTENAFQEEDLEEELPGEIFEEPAEELAPEELLPEEALETELSAPAEEPEAYEPSEEPEEEPQAEPTEEKDDILLTEELEEDDSDEEAEDAEILEPAEEDEVEDEAALAAGDPYVVTIDAHNFPDAAFRAVVRGFDEDGDGALNESEIVAVERIDCADCGIRSLEGIQVFHELNYLNCSGNQLNELPLEELEKLEQLDCADNSLTELKLEGNPLLTKLNCSDNQLCTLDLSEQVFLKELACDGNLLTDLELTGLAELACLSASGNGIAVLDLSDNLLLQQAVIMNAKELIEDGEDSSVRYYNADAELLVPADTAVLVPALAEKIRFDREYMALTTGDRAVLTVLGIPENWLPRLNWTVENSEGKTVAANVFEYDDNGTVTAKEKGTAFAIASIEAGGRSYKARCRIDVLDGFVAEKAVGVSLPVKTAEVELYKTDYTRISVVLEFLQNQVKGKSDSMSAVSDNRTNIIEDNGIAIENAFFNDETVAKYFDLRVRDDRTLEVVPTDYAIANANSFKGKLNSAITVEGAGWKAVTDVLILNLKKTMPSVKANAVKFNSFHKNELQMLVFTGVKVKSIEVDNGKNKGCPNWLELDTENKTLRLKDSAYMKKLSGKLFLNVTLEGWTESLKRPVTVSVSTAITAPKLKLSPATITLNPASGDTGYSEVLFANPEDNDLPITVGKITLNNKAYTNLSFRIFQKSNSLEQKKFLESRFCYKNEKNSGLKCGII